jgi:hypothetical protein
LAESWFSLSKSDQGEALQVAAARTGRPAHLLEKDIWVVWSLSAIYESSLADKLTFKGGTSLSKVYQIIDRFSEDIDLTYDIRELVPDLLKENNPIPASSSQEKKVTSAIRTRLPGWIANTVRPVIEAAIAQSDVQVDLQLAGKDNDKLVIAYQPLKTGTGYASASILLEFGGRATGEPHQTYPITTDIAASIEGVAFPIATPLVMAAQRTFWEKATAAHVYCLQGRLRSERYSRHWYDLAAMVKSGHAVRAIGDSQLAEEVAMHKAMFFAEKDANGQRVDYHQAVRGHLRLVPAGESRTALERDYNAMLEDGLLSLHQPTFVDVVERCQEIEEMVNKVAG